MPESKQTVAPAEPHQLLLPSEQLSLIVTLDVPAGTFRFEWTRPDAEVAARGELSAAERTLFFFRSLNWIAEQGGETFQDGCQAWPASTRAFLNRVRKRFPVSPEAVRIGLLTASDMGMAQAGRWLPMALPPGTDPWKWLGAQVLEVARMIEANVRRSGEEPGQTAMYLLACSLLGVAPAISARGEIETDKSLLDLRVTLDQLQEFIELLWSDPQTRSIAACLRIRCTGIDQLTWELELEGRRESSSTWHSRHSIREALERWLKRFPTDRGMVTAFWVKPQTRAGQPRTVQQIPFEPDESAYAWIEDNIVAMAEDLRVKFLPPGPLMQAMIDSEPFIDMQRLQRRWLRKEQKRAEQEARQRENMARLAEERERREQRLAEERKIALAKKAAEAARHPRGTTGASQSVAKQRAPLPPVAVHLALPQLALQDTAFPLADLNEYLLRERAALWWVSNQSDDLLCLPHCRIERLEYQVRTALRTLGSMRGRALLSDEVGLGKTIEAGLVVKELLTRGMVKRFLVLTVPSLVDQWEEELNEKFGLTTLTTNHAAARANTQQFWRSNEGIIASLHTLKQPAQLEIARQVHWDILIVDEAHYLRNRDSQAWQAVNALSRQFLLLLTATPVQNSLEELYNLVTLLQPGQLPSPKEFRARFFDPKRPRQPREPEELRRLLGQVMIRNTRANAGVKLPPRHAETVLFGPEESEKVFWQKWETEFRVCLGELSGSQASLWGRLLLQAAGSGPAAWRAALAKFPNGSASRRWREGAPLEASWINKCQLIPPLARVEGGLVIFTQFLETQAVLAEFLRGSGIQSFVINGATPAPDRQPITEEFRKHGGALLLTHSGTEGRNLQFCHRLVNFDLPWNPMEIEQRIGRLHRLGQRHPVHIYNFVQSGTLQEHLLELLQEKLNLFELVVGETGLVMGERFSSDEFAEEVFRCWRESEGRVGEAMAALGQQLADARNQYREVKQLDETLFAHDYESI
jgi:hypothetical protein